MIGTIFAFIGWFLLGVLGLLILLLVIPVGVYIDYSKHVFTLKVRVLFLKFTIISDKKKKKKKKTSKKKSKKNEEEKEEEQAIKDESKKSKHDKLSIEKILEQATTILKEIKHLLKILTKGVRIKNVIFATAVYKENAEDTALSVAKIQGLVNVLYGFLKSLPLKFSCKTIQIIPDFADKAIQKVIFSCQITISPIIIIIVGLLGLKAFFRIKDESFTDKQTESQSTKTR